MTRRLADGLSVDLAVLDCDLPEAAEVYAELHTLSPVATLLVFSDEPPRFAMNGTSQATRDDFALKPLAPDALVYRLQALLIRMNRQLPAELEMPDDGDAAEAITIGAGHVVSVFSPKGGVGKTTIAVNLAVALREQSRTRVCLIDADVGVGNVSSILDVPYRRGLADLADSPHDEWTDAAFEHLVTVHEPSGVHVLTWGNDPGQSEQVGVDLLLAAVRWARSHYPFVIIDNHPNYDDRTMAMLSIASEIFLVVTPEVGSIRNAGQFLGLARQVGLDGAVRVIVNRSNHGVSVEDVAAALSHPVSATIVSSGMRAVTAANDGTPMVTRFPHDRMSADMHGVARLLTQQASASPAPSAKPWWAALAARLSSA